MTRRCRGARQTVSTEALDGALIALTLADAADVYHVADGEGISLDDIAYAVSVDIVEAELTQELLNADIGLVEVTLQRFVYILDGNVAEAKLQRAVTIGFNGLLLHDHAGACLNDRYGYDLTVLVEQLSHTDFFCHNSLMHDFSSR